MAFNAVRRDYCLGYILVFTSTQNHKNLFIVSLHTPWDRKNMACELRIYLQTHLNQSKDSLFKVAQYERACLEEAFRRLEQQSWESNSLQMQARKRRQMEIWRMFYNVTDLFGQIYVLRDIRSRLAVGTAAQKNFVLC